MKRLIALAGVAMFLSPALALAGENPLLGTWKLKSIMREATEPGGKVIQTTENPDGYLSYSADGRMSAIGTWGDRVKPPGPRPENGERARLHETMFAYAGAYTLEGRKVIHHVDVSWNETWTGTDLVRFYELKGDTLTISTAPANASGNTVLVWEKVKPPPR